MTIQKAEARERTDKLANIEVRPGEGARIATAADAWTLAAAYHRAGMAPKSFTTEQQVFVAFLAASELGVGPTFAMKHFMVINNVPALWGDGAMALVERSGLQENWDTGTVGEPGTDEFGVWFETIRKGRKPHRSVFTKADALEAGLWDKSIWKQYRERMLFNRARAYALRNTYPDVLGGLAIAEEAMEYQQDELTGEHASRSDALLARLVEPEPADAVEAVEGDPGEPEDVPWEDVEREVAERDGSLFSPASEEATP